jgi:hypothetical protein
MPATVTLIVTSGALTGMHFVFGKRLRPQE